MRILAIDPATRCGYAHSDGRHGVWLLAGDESAKLSQLRANVRAMGQVEMIAVEQASYGAGKRKGSGIQWSQIVWQNMMLGVIKQVARELGATVQGFHPSTIKSFMAGSGRATKDQVRRAVKKLLGIETVDDNDSDAVAILELAKRPDCWAKKQPRKRKQKVLKRAKPMRKDLLFRK